MTAQLVTSPYLLHRLSAVRLKLEKAEGKDAHDPYVSLFCDDFTCTTDRV